MHTQLSKLGAADSLATEQHYSFPSFLKLGGERHTNQN